MQDASRKVYQRIYLDANASEPLRPAARTAALAALDLVGNPASIHTAGRAARRVLEESRAAVAASVGAAPAEVIFCSGGTEAIAMAIASLGAGRRVLVGATEHDAVRANAPGAETVPVLKHGTLDLAALHSALASGPASLVCAMLANNETGVLHPIAEVAALCRAHGARLHVDAVQALGRVKIDLPALGADTLALSGHKVGGPKGAGALVCTSGLDIRGVIAGGGQERGRRGGTPGLPAIAGFGAAVRAAERESSLSALRDRMEIAAMGAGAVVCGGGARLGNTTCLALPGVRAETQVIALDLAGIEVSAGAACSSGKVAESHVLAAMGLGALAGCAIRVSLPWDATEADAERFILTYRAMAERLRGSRVA